jgi:CRP-like cAMP-binding protein
VAKKTQAESDSAPSGQSRLFGSLGSPLVGLVKSRALEAGQVLLVQGAPNDTLYLVEEGELDVRLDTGKGTVDLGVKGRDGWVGEIGMLLPGPASATVAARSKSKVVAISHEKYGDLLTREPRAMGVALMHIACDLARRIRRTSEAGVGLQADGELELLPHAKSLAGVDRVAGPTAEMPKGARAKQMPQVDDAALMRTLEHLGLFRATGKADTSRLAALRTTLAELAPSGLTVQTHLHDEPIIEAGARADGVFLVLAGLVRVRVGTPASPLHTDKEMGPGALFGHQAFFDDHLCLATVTSLGASVVAVLWPTAVDEILRQSEAGTPRWIPLLDWFARQLAADARDLNTRLLSTLGGPARRAKK